MVKRINSTAAIALLVASCMLIPLSHAAERLSINRDGIKVWTYQSKDNPVMQYRAETVFKTSVENAVGLMLDTERAKQWIPYLADLRAVERDNTEGKMMLYMRLDMPFPLADRDLAVDGRLSKLPDGKVIFKNKSTTDARIPVNSGIVRIKSYQGDWTFQPIGQDQVKVTTSGYADPGGAIPISFVNTFVQQQPYQMLQKMRQELKTSRYTSADLPPLLR